MFPLSVMLVFYFVYVFFCCPLRRVFVYIITQPDTGIKNSRRKSRPTPSAFVLIRISSRSRQLVLVDVSLFSSGRHEIWHTKHNVQNARIPFRQLIRLIVRCGSGSAQLSFQFAYDVRHSTYRLLYTMSHVQNSNTRWSNLCPDRRQLY